MTFFQIGVTYVTLPIFKGFRAFSGGWHSKSKVTENRFTTKSKQYEKSSGSTLGFSVLGGAAFCCGAAVVIRPVNRLFFPFDVLSIFEMNEVKNVLLLLLWQEAIHGNQIGLLVLQRRTVAGQTLFLLEVLESRIAVILLCSLRTATPEDEIVQGDL